METLTPTTFLSGLKFPECPRWHNGRLWFSDMRAGRVMVVDQAGRAESIIEVPGDPGGLGFRPDGSLIVVSMRGRRLLRYHEGALLPFADLSAYEPVANNDMTLDADGRAYVGGFGFDIRTAGEQPRTTNLILVTPDGEVRRVAADLNFPNGIVISADGRTLIVAETFARRLTAFEVAPDGSLSGRRTFAEFPKAVPDGICIDAEGAVWLASPATREFLRVEDGGTITHRIELSGRRAYACMLGGEDRRTLFLCTAETNPQDPAAATAQGWIETVRVDVAGAGWP